jgi:hypothetical protein
MKASVISSMISLHDKSIEQEDKLRTDARHETAISAIRGIISGQIQTDSQLASMNLDSGQITAASSFLHRDGEAIDNRTLVSSIALAISQARSKSPIDQTADSVKLGDDADMALAKGMLSSKTYLDIKTQLTKLNEPIFNDPYYKEAITRAAGFLGADVATMGQGASTEDIMRAVFNNQPKVAAALAEFKFNLDNIAQHTPTGERAGLLSWTLNNIGPYMQTTAGKAASLGSTLRVKYPDVFDLDGHPKTGITRNGIEDKILTDKTLSKPEQDALLNQLPDYLSYLSRLQNLNQAQQQNKGVDVGG